LEKMELVGSVFAKRKTLEHFVRSAEGVPRDAINILMMAKQLSDGRRIQVPDVQTAARRWYTTDKSRALDDEADKLLVWVIDEVISHRRARAFMLPARSSRDPLIRKLYDARLIHLIRPAISAPDRPGERFAAYQIDYGAYVELLKTRTRIGLFEESDDGVTWVGVPIDDYRSIRQSVLDLQAFYDSGGKSLRRRRENSADAGEKNPTLFEHLNSWREQ
jgi:hypothetical protein